jgi:hypothetical protein
MVGRGEAGWPLGYRIEHAWWLAVHAAGEDARDFEALVAGVSDDRLRADLEASRAARNDGTDVMFVRIRGDKALALDR